VKSEQENANTVPYASTNDFINGGSIEFACDSIHNVQVNPANDIYTQSLGLVRQLAVICRVFDVVQESSAHC
jgi:hypothetical protein